MSAVSIPVTPILYRDPRPFYRIVAQLYSSATDVYARARLVVSFGAKVVHASLVDARARAAEQEEDLYYSLKLSEGFRCGCMICVVYGGDCAAQLSAEAGREVLHRWRRRSAGHRKARANGGRS